MVLSIIAYSLSAASARCSNTLSHTPAPGPAAKAGVDLLPGAEPLRQVAPGNAGTVAIEHGLHEQAVVLGGHAHMPGATGQQVPDPLPLIVAQGVAAHRAVSSGLQSPLNRPARRLIPQLGAGPST